MMNSELVAELVFPATSVATPSAIENFAVPAVPPAPVEFSATKLMAVIAAVVNAVVVIAQPVDSGFFVTSEISSPVTDLLNVIVSVALTRGAPGVAVKLPPEVTFVDVKVTVGRTVSICTLARAVDVVDVVVPLV